MSVWATTWAYEQTVRPVGRKFVLVCIADFTDVNGYSYPSQEAIAAMTDQGISTVREHLRALELEGLIKREHRYKEGGGRTSDGFWLQAPKERLKPPQKKGESIPPKAGAKGKGIPPNLSNHTAESQQTIPPNSGGDPLVKDDPLEDPPKEIELPFSGPDFLAALSAFEHSRTCMKKPITPEARRLLFKKLLRWGETNATQALEDSAINRWQGVFEPRETNGRTQPNGVRPLDAAERNAARYSENLEFISDLRRSGGRDPH